MTAKKKTGRVDKSALLAQTLPEEELEVPGLGTLTIRSLTRAQALGVAKLAEDGADLDTQEREWLRWGVADPEMSYQEIERWQKHAPSSQVGAVTDAIVRLSGAEEGADKAAYKSAGSGSGS